jgi:hypothetical protein
MSKGVVSMAKLKVFMQVIHKLVMLYTTYANMTKGRADAPALNELVRDTRQFIMSHKWAS